MVSSFQYNNKVIAGLAVHPDIEEQLKDKAERVASAARSIAPVLTGAYRTGIRAESGRVGPYVIARVNANDYKSHWIEAGTSDTPTFAVLRRALDTIT